MKNRILILTVIIPYLSLAQGNFSDTAFYSIYKKIFTTRCAIPTCHDGRFEPDLRTLSSAYATLVYHPIIKNNISGSFKYRVVPYDTAASVLFERITNCCFVNDCDQMPFTLGLTLSPDEIRSIREWIANGAKDVFGKVQHIINLPPDISDDYMAYYNDSLLVTNNADRENKFMYKPFRIYSDTRKVKMIFYITDDVSQPQDIKNVKLKITREQPSDSMQIPLRYQRDNSWVAEVETENLKKGNIYFMQVSVVDPVTGFISYFPDENSKNFDRNHWSFIVK